ncbi:MAG TPA: DUF881 domain-containing protein [Syntrophomonadaceae bacterium]|nr:DUF881 domain-containing protein [Syntrophomonadaceae bacterium]
MRSKGAQISIALVCLILGIMLAVQFNTTRFYKASLVPERAQDLAGQLDTVTKDRDALIQKVASLNEQLQNLRNNDKALADLQKELQSSNLSAGLIPVRGQGVVVTLNDSSHRLQPGEDPNTLLIHDYEILAVVNELKASGAEAISINEQRVVAMTEIRCAGTTIIVNQNRIGPPFVIKAIGNPDLIESGMKIQGGTLAGIAIWDKQATLEKADNIMIPAFNGVVNMKYSQPGK